MEYIRKIIREAIEGSFVDEIEDLPAELPYLHAFELKKVYRKKNGFMVAKFTLKTKNYILDFYVKRNIDTTWSANIKVYWKRFSNEPSNGAGKDYEYSFGTYATREELVDSLNSKLKNNFMFHTGMYQDDYGLKLSVLVFRYLTMLKSKIQDVKKLRNTEHYIDLESIYDKIKDLDEKDTFTFIESEYPDPEDKQTFLLVLQRLEKIEFYNFMEVMKGF
jgi:hypothetical protein